MATRALRTGEKEYGVRYVRSLVSRVYEDPDTKDLDITYTDGNGNTVTETFDLVVLAVGLRPSKQLAGLARVMGVATNEYGFIETGALCPFRWPREGIYVCWGSAAPRDISIPSSRARPRPATSPHPWRRTRCQYIEVARLPD
jgi:heterodisulfide reductase subunit A